MNGPANVQQLLDQGLSHERAGRWQQAEQFYRRACELAPNRADLHTRLAISLYRQGDPYGAAISSRRAVELAPDLAEAWSYLATALGACKKHDQALEAAQRCVELAPDRPQAHLCLGWVHQQAGRFDQAQAEYERAVQIDPRNSDAHRSLAALFDATGQVERAIACLSRALELRPNDVEGWNNLSTLQRRIRNYRGALQAAEMALKLAPGHPLSHGSRGLALLSLGDYINGFAEYEWRWRCENFTTRPRDFDQPMWDGSDPAGRTIFVHSEQGYGDTIQFVRYVPMLAERGATVILECALLLRTLLVGLKGPSRLIVTGMKPGDFDLHVPLLSLPRIFKTTLQTVPHRVPYLSVDTVRQDAWKKKIEAAGAGLKVGLTWAGNAKPDPDRTCPPEMLAPLGQVEGVVFISLQKREGMPQAMRNPPGLNLLDLSDELRDFADTAAVLMNLDLLITIDTAVAHLAGALARPTWTMLPWSCDWRWLQDRSDSPWYPTMRLFRQSAPGDWPSVVSQIISRLREVVRSGKVEHNYPVA